MSNQTEQGSTLKGSVQLSRGAEMLGGSYYWLDLTALGRQEDWEEPKDRAASVRGAVPDFAS